MNKTASSSLPALVTGRAGVFRLTGLALALGLAGCGGGGGTTTTTTQTGTPFSIVSGGASCGTGTFGCAADAGTGGGASAGGDGGDGAGGGLGQMRNVVVTARVPGGATLASAALQSNLVSVYPNSYTGAFILEFADDGSGNGAYYDEALQQWTALGSQKLHILVPALTHHVSANSLTEAAYQWAIHQYGSESALDAAKMTTANATVLAAINAVVPTGYTITDVTNYTAAVSDSTVANSVPNTNAGRLETVLAAQALAAQAYNIQQTNPIASASFKPALAYALELASDIATHGNITGTVAGGSAYGSDYKSSLASAVLGAWNLYAVSSQPTVAATSPCFNPALFTTPGTTETLTYNDTSSNPSTAPSTSTLSLTVNGTVPFNGITNAIEVAVNVSSSLSSGSTSTVLNYYDPNTSNGITAYGSVATTVVAPYTTVFTTIYSPPALYNQYLLAPGASSTSTTTSTGTTTINGSSSGSPVVVSDQNTTTFNGYFSVTVPAGTFNTCKYTTVDVSTPSGGSPTTSTSVQWITGDGFGVPVMTTSTSTVNGTTTTFTETLTSGTVNGVAVH